MIQGPPISHTQSVHPHACGDNSILANTDVLLLGSPPRVWGQFPAGAGMLGDGRFTPTRVGTMPRLHGSTHRSAVHPHACGDNRSFSTYSASYTGSPPRVWGQLRLGCLSWSRSRFTPTRVGTILANSALYLGFNFRYPVWYQSAPQRHNWTADLANGAGFIGPRSELATQAATHPADGTSGATSRPSTDSKAVPGSTLATCITPGSGGGHSRCEHSLAYVLNFCQG